MTATFMPAGTVYGTLLNSQREWQHWAAQMEQPPHKGAPRAPVLYVKTANTWSACGAAISMPAGVPELEIGATVALVIRPEILMQQARSTMDCVAGYVLLNDLCVPHASYFRPPVKYRCRDGLLGIGAHLVTPQQAGDPSGLKLQVRVNGDLVQTVDFAFMRLSAAQLLAEVSEFMTLQPHDLLMLGCDVLGDGNRPRARAGDLVEISAPGRPAFGSLSNNLMAQP